MAKQEYAISVDGRFYEVEKKLLDNGYKWFIKRKNDSKYLIVWTDKDIVNSTFDYVNGQNIPVKSATEFLGESKVSKYVVVNSKTWRAIKGKLEDKGYSATVLNDYLTDEYHKGKDFAIILSGKYFASHADLDYVRKLEYEELTLEDPKQFAVKTINPQMSELIQKHAFKLGYRWLLSSDRVQETDKEYLFFWNDKRIAQSNEYSYGRDKDFPLISLEEFFSEDAGQSENVLEKDFVCNGQHRYTTEEMLGILQAKKERKSIYVMESTGKWGLIDCDHNTQFDFVRCTYCLYPRNK